MRSSSNAAGFAALRLVAIELLCDRARRAPDPAGYLASRRATILAVHAAAPAGNPASLVYWRRGRAIGREIDALFAAAAAGL